MFVTHSRNTTTAKKGAYTLATEANEKKYHLQKTTFYLNFTIKT